MKEPYQEQISIIERVEVEPSITEDDDETKPSDFRQLPQSKLLPKIPELFGSMVESEYMLVTDESKMFEQLQHDSRIGFK